MISSTSSSASRLIMGPYHLPLASSSSLQCLPPHLFWSLHSISSIGSDCISSYHVSYHLILASLIFSAMSIPLHIFWSLHSMISSTGSSASRLMGPYHLRILCNGNHSTYFIPSFHNIFDRLSGLSSYYLSIPSHLASLTTLPIPSFLILSLNEHFHTRPSHKPSSVFTQWNIYPIRNQFCAYIPVGPFSNSNTKRDSIQVRRIMLWIK